MEIIKLKPVGKDALWGGDKLGKLIGVEDRLAELWLLSTHEDGQSLVVGGKSDGLTLTNALPTSGAQALASILVKLIDAKQDLSVQVHPDDAYAQKTGQANGKTEAWYIVDCEPNAKIYCGLKSKMTTQEFQAVLQKGELVQAMQAFDVKKGDCFFIPAGTVHAIGAGCVICEVQQNSNTTYRLFDYGRVGQDGLPRPLHLSDGLQVATLDKYANQVASKSQTAKQLDKAGAKVLVDCAYFVSAEIDTTKCPQNEFVLPALGTPLAITVVRGTGMLSYDSVDNQGFGFLQFGDSLCTDKVTKPIKFLGEMTVLVSIPKE
ncbi:MAG: class I mannose-6-phosphate isomerase [Firmicutes bacterium]|nr:class I mannose-6-phosphate isomerase [Bacillota bacterium]